MNRRTQALVLTLLLVVTATTASAQVSTARGEVKDAEGNPIVGALLQYFSKSNPTLIYKGKTNKKGKYYIGGLFSGKEKDTWSVTVTYEGFVPTKMEFESRTVNQVMVSDATKNLKPGTKIEGLPIAPLGTIELNFVMTPEAEVQAQVEQEAAAAQAEAQKAAEAVQKKDPWEDALSLASQGDLEGAVPHFAEAVEEEAEDAERRRAYAQVLYQLERYEEAETQAQSAVELQPDAVENLMVLYSVHVGRGDLEQAGSTLEQAKQLDPGNVEVLRQQAFVAGQGGDKNAEIAAYEAIVAAAPDDTEAWLSLGDLYFRAGDSGKSEEAYRKVSELSPDNAHQIFFNLGALMVNKPNRTEAQTQKAITAFRKAVEIKPDYVQAHKELAFALLNVGDRDGARGALEQYVKHAPKAPDAPQMQALIKSLSQ